MGEKYTNRGIYWCAYGSLVHFGLCNEFLFRSCFILFQGPELPFQLNAFTMMTNRLNGFLTIGGWSPTRSERLNEIWEMVCDAEVNFLSFENLS